MFYCNFSRFLHPVKLLFRRGYLPSTPTTVIIFGITDTYITVVSTHCAICIINTKYSSNSWCPYYIKQIASVIYLVELSLRCTSEQIRSVTLFTDQFKNVALGMSLPFQYRFYAMNQVNKIWSTGKHWCYPTGTQGVQVTQNMAGNPFGECI